MADNKKEMEREELHRAIWAIADVSELLTRLGTVGKTGINKVYEKALYHRKS